MSADIERDEAARLWAIRVEDPDFADWDAFTAWLEADPGHAAAYDAALADAAAMVALLRTPASRKSPTKPAPAARWRPGWRWTGGAVAAALLAVAGWTVWQPGPQPREIASAPGERRVVDLADGSQVTLNGGTRLILSADGPRRATLVEGEALFSVRHDDANPFVVTSGKVRLVDAGTVFNVVRDGATMRVAVAEGAVIYQPGAGEVRLAPGAALEVADGADPVVGQVAPEQVGSWRAGQLVYSNARLDRVARDLSRNLGTPIAALGGSEKLRFTGILTIEGRAETVLPRIAPLMGVRVTRSATGWTMRPAGSARR